jgi:hypothetical protein
MNRGAANAISLKLAQSFPEMNASVEKDRALARRYAEMAAFLRVTVGLDNGLTKRLKRRAYTVRGSDSVRISLDELEQLIVKVAIFEKR